MEKEKFSLSGFFAGLKTIFTRNSLLILAITVLNYCGHNMKNGFRTLYGSGDLGLTPAVIGVALSVFTIAGMLSRAPAGGLADNLVGKLRLLLCGSLLGRCLVWLIVPLMQNSTAYFILFALDGITWSFTGTIMPVVLALSVDRRAMGTAYAAFMGLPSTIGAFARPLGISLYNNNGIGTASLVAAAFFAAGAVLALCMDEKGLTGSAAAEPKAAGAKKKNIGISWSMLPLALIAAMPMVIGNTEQNFLTLFAEAEGLEYLGATALGGAINGVLGMFIGVLCDIISPTLIIIVVLAGTAVSAFLWSIATTSEVLGIGIVLYYICRCYATPMRILGMKAVSRAEQGALSSTIYLTNDLMGVVCNPLIGVLAGVMSYRAVFRLEVFWGIATVVLFIIWSRTTLKKTREENAGT